MSSDELEATALKLEEENAQIWAEEAQRRAEAMDSGALASRSAEEVFRDARSRI